LIALADFLIPNETELSLLTGVDVKDIPSVEKAARVLLAKGSQKVIVTLGSKGALIVNRETSTHIDTYHVDVVDTTAAGDAFIGGFASVLGSANSLADAVRFGCACGALATTKFGAQPSLPTKDEVERFMSLRVAL
jgi:ribokinase